MDVPPHKLLTQSVACGTPSISNYGTSAGTDLWGATHCYAANCEGGGCKGGEYETGVDK